MILPAFLSLLSPSAPARIPLEGAWRLTQEERRIDVPARVPGVVQTDLVRAGIIPDPYLGTNEKAAQWVGDLPWSYSRRFHAPAGFLSRRRIVLRCDGLDTFATIRINGREIARADNFYRTWEFDAKPYLHEGENTIQVDFETVASAIARTLDRPAKFGFPIQENGKPYVRKPAFQGGWDFAPKLMTVGIWRGIGLVGWDDRLTDTAVKQDHSQPGQVRLDVRAVADAPGATSARTTVLFKGRKVAEARTAVRDGVAASRLTVAKPRLWWPNEMGPQNLYDVRVELLDSRGGVLDRSVKRIGLRTVAWIPKTDETPLGLRVNGRRFFAKGSNWVPYDSLLRENPAGERALVERAADAHMNLMRIWGGGYYVDDAFLDACDEKGVLVWFEFGYANSPYPSFDPEWLAKARAEAEDNVRRTRNHPCLAVYSGNNEITDRIADVPSSWQIGRREYDLLFRTTLRDVVGELAPDVPYTPGSPEIGDTHYWNVWHGAEGFDAYTRLHGFMSEYGFQAVPVPRTVEAFTTPEERASFGTSAMQNHHKNWRDAYALIASTARRAYRRPKDFDSTIWLSQIQQADGILTGVEHWRRDWPNSTASLVWQFNDPWPVTSWSMIDYFGRPKALYYRLKHAYAPVMLSGTADPRAGMAEFWVATDRTAAKKARLEWTLTRLDGAVVDRGDENVAVPAGTSSARVWSRNLKAAIEREGASKLLLWGVLRTPNEPDSTTLLTFAKKRDLDLPNPGLKATVKPAGAAYRVILESQRPALDAWIEIEGVDAELSDNFVHVRPGTPIVIDVLPEAQTTLAEMRRALSVRSLVDTYAPGTEPVPAITPGADGTVVADADDADLVGAGPSLEPGAPSNIGVWRSLGGMAVWTVRDLRAGRYKVSATVAAPAGDAGGTFEVVVAGARVAGNVPTTKSWTDYVTVDLGDVTVAGDGTGTIVVRGLTKPNENLMNLRSIVLTKQ